MAKPRAEVVSASFHYLERYTSPHLHDRDRRPFSQAELGQLFKALQQKPAIDLHDEKSADRLRYRQDCDIIEIQMLDSRTIVGTFKGSYWGHAFDNTAKGHIPADSISLRPFHFLLYLSDSGRIYLCVQYIGNFGGYQQFERTIKSLIDDDYIETRSFIVGGGHYKDAVAKEVHLKFSSKPKSINADNLFGTQAAVVFKKISKDDGFEGVVSKKLLSVQGKDTALIKKAIADLANESALLDVNDEDVEDCTVIAQVNGKRRTIHIFDNAGFATKMPIAVKIDPEGHPYAEETWAAMIELLSNRVISKKEDV